MPQLLTAKSAVANIEEIIREARTRLILISAYINVSETFMNRLKGTARYNVPITFVAREGSNKPAEVEKLLSTPNLSLYTLKDLHAKCYLNENRLVISSLNLYEASEKNWEMGVQFTSDEPIYSESIEEVEAIIGAATPMFPPKTESYGSRPATTPTKRVELARPAKADRHRGRGACIRCSRDITHNHEAPLCRDCWSIWAEFKNPEYVEHFCHDCGRPAKTSMSRPRCRSCFTAGAR